MGARTAVLAALALAGCASAPRAPPLSIALNSVAALTGWAGEDPAAALTAFQAVCGRAAEPTCRAIHSAGRLDETAARRFFEARFLVEPIEGEGLLTAYFSPVSQARHAPAGDFMAPVLPLPEFVGEQVGSHRTGPPTQPDRAEIERIAAAEHDALAWMRPEDLFFLQIQGSGALTFPDGVTMRAIFAGTNERPFVSVAKTLVAEGRLDPAHAGASDVRGWLAAHRGPEADAAMDADPRYVFFRLAPDDGAEPKGSAGLPLVAGRSLAVDPASHGDFELFWIDASAPRLAGGAPTYRRLAMALDTGGAIKGPVRADLYLGRGDAAGEAAGRVDHALRLYRLVPR